MAEPARVLLRDVGVGPGIPVSVLARAHERPPAGVGVHVPSMCVPGFELGEVAGIKIVARAVGVAGVELVLEVAGVQLVGVGVGVGVARGQVVLGFGDGPGVGFGIAAGEGLVVGVGEGGDGEEEAA